MRLLRYNTEKIIDSRREMNAVVSLHGERDLIERKKERKEEKKKGGVQYETQAQLSE